MTEVLIWFLFIKVCAGIKDDVKVTRNPISNFFYYFAVIVLAEARAMSNCNDRLNSSDDEMETIATRPSVTREKSKRPRKPSLKVVEGQYDLKSIGKCCSFCWYSYDSRKYCLVYYSTYN